MGIVIWLWAVVLAVVLDRIGKCFEDIVYPIFALPAAKLAGLFLGTSPRFDEEGIIELCLAHSTIHVTPNCAGYGFFCLVAAMLALFYRDIGRGMPAIVRATVILFAAYLITITANGFRIISGYWVNIVTAGSVPLPIQNLAHLAVGIFTFLTVLLLVYLAAERRNADVSVRT